MSRLLAPEEVQEFKTLIDNYRPNNEVLEVFRASNLAVLAGPAGSGKDTLRNELVIKYPESYMRVLSTTTRPPREGEEDGKIYHFREIEFVRQALQNREFFQAALVHNQQVSCLHINEIRKLNPDQFGLSILIPITETELRLIKNDIKSIFLIPPDYQTFNERLNASRSLDREEIDRRIDAARKEIEYALKCNHYYCMVSDTVEGVTERAHKYLQYGELDEESHTTARETMHKIHDLLRS